MLFRSSAVLVFVVFAIGLDMQPLGGAQVQPSGESGHHRHPAPSIDEQVKKLTQDLDLDLEQQAKAKTILERRQMQARRILSDTSLSAVARFNTMKAVYEQSNDQIRSILNAEQVSKFDQSRRREAPRTGESEQK